MAKTGHKRRTGFTLVEIMIVVAIIGLLAAIAVPNFAKARKTSQNTAFARSLRTFADAFEIYAAERGAYPQDTMPRMVPPGMDTYLNVKQWQADTPIGGQWDWDNGQFGFRAGVSVYEPRADLAQMIEVDKIIDDGNLGSGQFRARAQGYMLIIEE